MEDSQIDEVLAQIENVDDLPEINDLVTGLSPNQADPPASI